jgi:peptide/nickel transport system permease protein
MSERACDGAARTWWRQPLARVACAVLVGLIALAIFAPLIANDRPYYLRAIDVGAHESARLALDPIARECARLGLTDPARYQGERGGGARKPLQAALREELTALHARVEVLRVGLEDGAPPALAALEQVLERIDHSAPRAADWDELVRVSGEARDALRIAPGETHPTVAGARLRARVRWPLFESLGLLDVFCIVSACALIASAAWPRLRRKPWLALALGVGAALGASACWAWLGPARSPFAAGTIKSDLAAGRIVAEQVVFAPIAMGFAETNLSETQRPPTWLASAARGAAQPAPDARFAPTRAEVIVRPGEPALNSPWRHLLGTDVLGRDVLARILWGARTSLVVGIFSAVLLTLIGTLVGAVAGQWGGWFDFVVSRAIELLACFPAFFLVLCVLFFVDPDIVPPLVAVAGVIAVVGWTSVARLVRAEILKLRELEFVLAARAAGLGELRILFAHVLPNALTPVLIAFAFAVSSGILTESSLSFLGLGVRVPFPSWGSLVSESARPETWWMWVFPGLFIFVTVVAFNAAADALRDALDPRSES